ncbi:MAG: aspartate carbamoyltransferase [Gammaproteobacteria bacterium]
MKNYLLILTGLLLFSMTASAFEKNAPEPVGEVQQRMQKLVPFSLDKTIETFTKTVHGGVQHLVAKSPNDTPQIKQIQAHLHRIANEFRKGNFSATERIHGPNMPGLLQLKKAEPDDIRFVYEALPDGAQIHYSSEWPQYVEALHEWFDAQKIEHGNEEIPSHIQHHNSVAE